MSRLHDRGKDEDKITFMPSILPRYLHKAQIGRGMIAGLYLKGISTDDFTEALVAWLEPQAK